MQSRLLYVVLNNVPYSSYIFRHWTSPTLCVFGMTSRKPKTFVDAFSDGLYDRTSRKTIEKLNGTDDDFIRCCAVIRRRGKKRGDINWLLKLFPSRNRDEVQKILKKYKHHFYSTRYSTNRRIVLSISMKTGILLPRAVESQRRMLIHVQLRSVHFSEN